MKRSKSPSKALSCWTEVRCGGVGGWGRSSALHAAVLRPCNRCLGMSSVIQVRFISRRVKNIKAGFWGLSCLFGRAAAGREPVIKHISFSDCSGTIHSTQAKWHEASAGVPAQVRVNRGKSLVMPESISETPEASVAATVRRILIFEQVLRRCVR